MIKPCRQFVVGRRRLSAGMTLVEVMVVVAVSTILLSLVVSLAIALKQADRTMRHHGVTSARLMELSERLRTDVRQGTEISLSAANVLLVMLASGEQHRYELGPEGCKRSVVSAGEAMPRGDLYAIGPAESWTIDKGPTGRHPLFKVTLSRPDLPDAKRRQRGVPLVVYAELGADLPPAPIAVTDN